VNGVFKNVGEKSLAGQSKSTLVFLPSLFYLATSSLARIVEIVSVAGN
jgi:hypothetical protein